jgi:MFS family permease
MSPAAADALPRRVPGEMYAIAGLAGCAIGLFGVLVAALLARAGWSEVEVGRNGSLFFLCVALAAPLAGALMRRSDGRAVLAAGLALAAASAIAFPLLPGDATWTLLRAILGLGVGLYMVAGQTALTALAPEGRRATASGLQALAFGVGVGVGPLIGAAIEPLSPALAFGAGAFALLAGQCLVLRLPPLRVPAHAPADPGLWRRVLLPLHAVFAYGSAEATLVSLFPVFMLRAGHDLAGTSTALAAFVAGSLLSVLPVTRAADRWGAPRAIGACAALGAVASATLTALPPHTSAWSVAIVSGVAGAAVGPLFPLALGALGASLHGERRAAGTAWFTMAFSLGSLCAPWLAGLAMRHWGAEHVFSLTTLLLASLLLHLLWRSLRAPLARGWWAV